MTEVTIGEKTYSLGYTMLAIVRAKALTGKGFFALAAKEQVGEGDGKLDPEAAMEKVLDLLLLGLQTNHADEFKTIEDVARAFPGMGDIAAVTQTVNVELTKFLSVDESLQKQLLEAQKAAGKDTKKKSRLTRSPKTNSQPNAESASV